MGKAITSQVGQYGDSTPMPFGKFKSQKLVDVPAWYLLDLWYKKPISDKKLQDYIEDNLDVLNKEKYSLR